MLADPVQFLLLEGIADLLDKFFQLADAPSLLDHDLVEGIEPALEVGEGRFDLLEARVRFRCDHSSSSRSAKKS